MPLPTPSPTPSPTATPVTDINFAAAADGETSASVERSLAAEVATASAEYLEETTANASEQTVSAKKAFFRAMESPSEAEVDLVSVREALAAASDAYHKAEAAIFLVDPYSIEELRLQPDPFGVGVPGSPEDKITSEVASLIKKMEKMLSRPLKAEDAPALFDLAQNLGAKIDELEAGLKGFADAWQENTKENFRSKFFLNSAEGAVARIFQGLLAVTGEVIPARLDGEQNNQLEISAGLDAVKDIYLGSDEPTANEPSPHLLVEQASIVQAALTRASIARSVALAELLQIFPDDKPLRGQLRTSLEDVTRQLTLAAQSLGIVIITSED